LWAGQSRRSKQPCSALPWTWEALHAASYKAVLELLTASYKAVLDPKDFQ